MSCSYVVFGVVQYCTLEAVSRVGGCKYSFIVAHCFIGCAMVFV